MSAMATTGERLARVIAFQEGIARRSAQKLAAVPGGFAVLDDRYPASYEHNQLYVTARVTAGVVVAEADRLLRQRSHRFVTALDGDVARRITPGMLAAGFREEGTVVMLLTGRPDAPRGASIHAVRVPLEEVREADARAWDERFPGLRADVVEQLFERRYTTAAACDLTTHVVRSDGAVVAWCNLYRVGREAQVESVNTLPPWRRRGFARAVVLDAVSAAREAGCELVFLVADRDDWPRDFYGRLGFEVIAEQRSFVRVLD
jgi:N-acetylglutamate synthase-like GNAT family acetyltransferase